jgi:hypothetical protein
VDNDSNFLDLFARGGGAGIAIPLGTRVAFDAMLGYNSLTIKEPENNAHNERVVMETFGLRLGFSVLIGSR